MPPTLLEESRSNLVAGPAFVLVRGATLAFALGAFASLLWLHRMRRCRLATLSIDDSSIVMTPRGTHPEPRTIVRRPDSRLVIHTSRDGSPSPRPLRGRS